MFKLIIVLVVILSLASSAFAQSAPTINIPVDDIFTQMNQWIQVIAPIFSVGIGISLAFAVLGFIGNVLIDAFRRRGGR